MNSSGFRIDRTITDEENHPQARTTRAADRDAMAGELSAAQGDLSASLIELRGMPNADPALIGQGEQQLAVLLSLKGQLATASGRQLAAIGAEIATLVTAALATARAAQQATAVAGGTPWT